MNFLLSELKPTLVAALEGLAAAPKEERWFIIVECGVNPKWFVQFYGSRAEGLFLDLPFSVLPDVHRTKIMPSPDLTSLYACQWHCEPSSGAEWADTIFRKAFELPDDAELVLTFDAQRDGEPN